jgi:hypothetical protein
MPTLSTLCVFGGLGNGLWAHATSPVRVKTVSGLRECECLQEVTGQESCSSAMTSGGTDQNDRDVTFTRLDILDAAVKNPDGTNFGRDVFVWGYNEHYQVSHTTPRL